MRREDFLAQHSEYEEKGGDLFFQYIMSTRECEKAFEKYRYRLIFIGHNHTPGINRLTRGTISYIPVKQDTEISLDPESRYIITVGTPKQCIAIYDSTAKKIMYRFIKDLPAQEVPSRKKETSAGS